MKSRSVGELNDPIKYLWKDVGAGWIWLIAIDDAVKTVLDEEYPEHVGPSAIIG